MNATLIITVAWFRSHAMKFLGESKIGMRHMNQATFDLIGLVGIKTVSDSAKIKLNSILSSGIWIIIVKIQFDLILFES